MMSPSLLVRSVAVAASLTPLLTLAHLSHPAAARQDVTSPIAASIPSPPQRPMGPGRGGPPADMKIVDRFDRDGDKRLNRDERDAARQFLASSGAGQGGRRGGPGMPIEPGTVTPGPPLSPADVASFAGDAVYDARTLRTFFLEFEGDDWEAELSAFAHTDVEIPATLTIDGQRFRDVGVHFRGASSLMAVPEGRKRSLNLSLDFVNDNQAFRGYRTFNLLNSHTDPTFLRTMLYLQAARDLMPAPQANYVRVVINGESWGIYVSAQQFNKDFLRDFYKTTEGARWKVPGSPGGRGGLEYLGDDPAPYKRIYEIKSKDDAASWQALVTLTRVLNETPAEQLEAALTPMLDIDETLRFLALEATLVNGDGYWVRASDYSLYRDPAGRFHVIPHDANETFGPGGSGGRGGPRGAGPGGGFGPPRGRGPMAGGPGREGGGPGRGPGAAPPGGRGGGPELDPLVGLDDATKPLRSKLLAVPALQTRYLHYVRQIANIWLDWSNVESLARRYQSLIAADVKADTRKLDSDEAFDNGVALLKLFIERRRAYLDARLAAAGKD